MNLTITDTDAPALADALDAAAVSLRRDADRCDRRALSSRWGDVQAALSEHALELRERAAAFQGYVHQLRRNGPA